MYSSDSDNSDIELHDLSQQSDSSDEYTMDADERAELLRHQFPNGSAQLSAKPQVHVRDGRQRVPTSRVFEEDYVEYQMEVEERVRSCTYSFYNTLWTLPLWLSQLSDVLLSAIKFLSTGINHLVDYHFCVTVTAKTGLWAYWTFTGLYVSERWRKKAFLAFAFYLLLVNVNFLALFKQTTKLPGHITHHERDSIDGLVFSALLVVLFSSETFVHISCILWRFHIYRFRKLKRVRDKLKVPTASNTPLGQASGTHLECGGLRNMAFTDAIAFATENGLRPYFLGVSRRIREFCFENGYDNSGMLLAPDLINRCNQSGHSYNLTGSLIRMDHVIVIIDFDYFIDMNYVLSLGSPVMLYTFNPDLPAAQTEEVSFSTVRRDDVDNFHVSIHGGSDSYFHPLWRYPHDEFSVCQRGVRIAYKIIRRRSKYWESIYLLPINSTIDYEDSLLERQSWTTGGLAYRTRPNGLGAISTLGAHTHVRLSQKQYEMVALKVALVLRGSKIAASQLQIYLANESKDLREDAGVIAREFTDAINAADRPMSLDHRFTRGYTTPEPSFPEYETATFQCEPPDVIVDNEPKPPSVTILTSPVITGAAVFNDKSEGTNYAGMQARVLGPAIEAYKDFSCGGLTLRDVAVLAYRFAEEEFGPHSSNWRYDDAPNLPLEVFEYEEVVERQKLPSQVADQGRCFYDLFGDITSATEFTKIEANSKVGDARIIINIKGNRKLHASSLIYPFSDMVKKKRWCAPGMKPPEIAARMAEVLTNYQECDLDAALTDYNRFDARFGVGHVVCRILMLYCMPDYEFEIGEMFKQMGHFTIHKDIEDQRRSTHGETLPSGVPATSVFGTTFNAFMSWVYIKAQGLDNRCLGVYSGDDGVGPHVGGYDGGFELFFKIFGHNLDLNIKQAGDPVDFLGRIYSPETWYGRLDSMIDPDRCLSKFHVSANCTVKESTIRLFEKAYALKLSDANTPLIGPMVQAHLELGRVLGWRSDLFPKEDIGFDDFKLINKNLVVSISYWGAVSAANPLSRFPNDNGDFWMNGIFENAGIITEPLTKFYTEKIKLLSGMVPTKHPRYSRAWLLEAEALKKHLRVPPSLVVKHVDRKVPANASVIVSDSNGRGELVIDGDGKRNDTSIGHPPTNYIAFRGDNVANVSDGWYKNMCAFTHTLLDHSRLTKNELSLVIYSGSHGSTDLHSVLVIKKLFPKLFTKNIFYFDPTYLNERYAPLKKELSKTATIRSSFRVKEMKEIMERPGNHTKHVVLHDDIFDTSKTTPKKRLAMLLSKVTAAHVVLDACSVNKRVATVSLKIVPFEGKLPFSFTPEVHLVHNTNERRLRLSSNNPCLPFEWTWQQIIDASFCPHLQEAEVIVSDCAKHPYLTDEVIRTLLLPAGAKGPPEPKIAGKAAEEVLSKVQVLTGLGSDTGAKPVKPTPPAPGGGANIALVPESVKSGDVAPRGRTTAISPKQADVHNVRPKREAPKDKSTQTKGKRQGKTPTSKESKGKGRRSQKGDKDATKNPSLRKADESAPGLVRSSVG